MNREKLSTKAIEEVLINKHFFDVNVEDMVNSTNDVVKIEAENKKPEGYVFIANKQNAGKGRLGRKFYSPSNSGIYMSVLFRPQLEANKTILFTPMAALAVCKAIREILHYDVHIKWVNDILLDGKKVCGILTEGKINQSNSMMDYIVLGIGINVDEPKGGFPDEISDIATSLVNSNDRKCIDKNLKNKLIAKILDWLYFYYMDKKLNEEYIRKEYTAFCSTIDKEINIINGDEIEEARVLGIDKNIGLIVKNNKGIRTLYSGEISIREK